MFQQFCQSRGVSRQQPPDRVKRYPHGPEELGKGTTGGTSSEVALGPWLYAGMHVGNQIMKAVSLQNVGIAAIGLQIETIRSSPKLFYAPAAGG
jgi:hypothetical protein